MGRLFRIFLAVMVVASIIQAFAMSNMWGIDSQQDLIDELRDEIRRMRYPDLWSRFGNIFILRKPNQAKIILGSTGTFLIFSWAVLALIWITGENKQVRFTTHSCTMNDE